MHRSAPPLAGTAICLAALAGFVDALAFIRSGGFFAAFMSGNATRLGVGLGDGRAGEAAVAGALVLSFVAGVIVASVIVRAAAERHGEAVMILVAALLGGGALLTHYMPGTVALLPLAAAMGAAHLLVDRMLRASGAVAGLTAALVGAGERAAAALMGDADRWGWLAHFLPWIGFVAGAVLGAALQTRFGTGAWWLAALAAAVAALWLAGARRRRA